MSAALGTCCGHDMMLVELRDVYDGALWRECGDCGRREHRWPEGDWRHAKAEALWRTVRQWRDASNNDGGVS